MRKIRFFGRCFQPSNPLVELYSLPKTVLMLSKSSVFLSCWCWQVDKSHLDFQRGLLKKLSSRGRREKAPTWLQPDVYLAKRQQTNDMGHTGSSRNISGNISIGIKQKNDREKMQRDLTWMLGGLEDHNDAVRAGNAEEEKGPGRL